MSDRIDQDRDVVGTDAEKHLWGSLALMAQAEPDRSLRSRVFQAIDRQTLQAAGPWWQRFLPALPQQVATLALVTLIGSLVGYMVGSVGDELDARVARLETELSSRNQQLLLSQLNAASAPERLAAALRVSRVAQRDAVLADALMQRAARDPVASVRSAAITAIGDDINQSDIAEALFLLLAETDSPIVQMAIVDLALRHGDAQVIRELRARVNAQQLHPSLDGYVSDAIQELKI